MHSEPRGRAIDPFLVNYTAKDLRIASEFLSNWMPFLSRGLCSTCTESLANRIQFLDSEVDGDLASPLNQKSNFAVLTPDSMELNEFKESHENCDSNSLGSWKQAADMNEADTNSQGSWKEGANDWSEPVAKASFRDTAKPALAPVRKLWADMVQEDEFEGDEESEVCGNSVDGHAQSGEDLAMARIRQNAKLSRDRREFVRFSNVKRKKDFICLERYKGKIVNILEGLELHTGVFSAVEQKRIVDFVYTLKEMGKRGELKNHTFTAPRKRMRGKGRVTIQFGCCYNDAIDKNGNIPGILQNENVDPIPPLFKVIIRRLVRWHVLPPSCVPDSCIVNIYEEGECIPPHIDNHDFVRPFCTVSFLSKCNILFGSNLKVLSPGEFDGPMAIPLPVGSVLVLAGNVADVAKHCVPAVPAKRISITFRKMDESKRPHDFVPEPDLQGLEPLSYKTDRSNWATRRRPEFPSSDFSLGPEIHTLGCGVLGTPKYPPTSGENNRDKSWSSSGRRKNYSEPNSSLNIQLGSNNRGRVRLSLGK